MKASSAQMVLDCLRKAVQPDGAGPTDGQLLRQYVTRRDESAFALLVRRHGPMVLAVCRRMLRHAQDAEDAFQATFVILARKGHRIDGRQTLGGWLHGVAYRVALDVRRRTARHQSKECQVEDMPQPTVLPEEPTRDLLGLLDRELARLPDKYRLPVVLCELEGRSRKEAARQLGLPEGTLSSRLATARKTLARRMAGYGAAVTAASLDVLFASEACAACVPAALLSSTIRAAGGAIPATVAALAEGVLKAMFLAKIKPTVLTLLMTVCLSAGAVTLTYGAGTEPGTKATPPSAAAKADKYDLEALRLEVQALRASLEATRERVKSLEADAVAQKALENSRNTSFEGFRADSTARARVYPNIGKATLLFDPETGKQRLNLIETDNLGSWLDKRTGKLLEVKPDERPGAAKPGGKSKEEAAYQEDNLTKVAVKVLLEQNHPLKEAAAKVLLEPGNAKARLAFIEAVMQMNRQAKPKSADAPK
jgi:RNA polymerase sigma factor (sigma-70 family)